MLGFILSKMQMLLFAVGIAVVALMFYEFVSMVGLSESASRLLEIDARVISDQLNNDLLCSFKTASIPDRLSYGINATNFFYDLEFSKTTFGEGDDIQNLIIMRIAEHRAGSPDKRKIAAAKSIATDAEVVLVAPDFIKELSGLSESYGRNEISLYPRAASKSELKASSPNAFAVVKEVKLGKKYIYIIPCATEKEPNNCLRNILRVGCHKLKTEYPALQNDTPVDSCFNISTQAETSVEKSKNYNWSDCITLFPEVVNAP